MKYVDIKSRFLKVLNPSSMSFWWRLRLFIASLIYPPFAKQHDEWLKHYFNHEYMLHVHQHYESEHRALNKALIKKNKKIKELSKLLNINKL